MALELLSLYADRSWTSGSDQMARLEAFIDVFRTLSDDSELCLRAIGLDDRISRSAVATFGQLDYKRITPTYELLVEFFTELERLDDSAHSRELRYLEASKEAAFCRTLPVCATTSSAPKLHR